MFKPYYGTCDQCPADRQVLIVINKPHLCNYHNRLRKGKEIISSIKPKKRKPTGEMDMFQAIWSERLHVSEVSGRPLGDVLKPVFFSHILTKAAYPRFRLNKDNVELVTPDEHNEWETGDRSDSKWKRVKEKAQMLKEKYYQK